MLTMKHQAKRQIFAPFARWICLIAMIGLFQTSETRAQQSFGLDDVFTDFSLNGFGSNTDEPVELSAQYFADASGQGRLEIEANLGSSWHIYSTTQKAGGPTRTKISITAPSSVQVAGDFTPNHQPHKSVSSIYDGLTVEEHEGTILWSAPLKLPSGFEAPITVTVNGLVCKSGGDNRCMPVAEELTAEFAGSLATNLVALNDNQANVKNGAAAFELQPESAAKPFRDGDYVVEWSAVAAPKQIASGQSGVLQFTAKPDAKFHVYKSTITDAKSSTNFVVTKKDGLLVGEPVADKPAVTVTLLPSQPPISYYKGKVTWQLPIEIPAGTPAGEKTIEGMIAYQACTDTSCHRPTALKFTAKVMVGEDGEGSAAQPAAIVLASAKSATALDAAATTEWADPIKLKGSKSNDLSNDQADENDLAAAPAAISTPSESSSFPLILAFAFLGGVILNVMPCVLPVVGLKIMGFVSQAGEDRKRVMSLNLAYVAGIFVVFAALAALAIVFNFGWGQQFQYFSVRLGVTVGLFAFALSYFNIWEIPVPGMAGGQTSQELQKREGFSGAFSKGVFATLLATPCSGPLLGGVFGATIGLGSAQVGLIFMTMALGMSTPYLLIGANPSWIKWLPKPGAWMETFKQFMAFFFLAAVAYFFYQFSDENKFPVFVTLMGVWFGCWIIGLVPNWDTLQKRMLAWVGGITVATAIGMSAFSMIKAESQLQWVDYNEASLRQYQAQGKTVLVDFSAKWCPNCLFNLETAIDTDETRKLVDELDAIVMYADWTNHDPEVTRKLEELNSNSIPVLAIYPGDRPSDPIVLRDIVTQSTVLSALRSAGPSVDKTSSVTVGASAAIASTSH